MFSLLIFASKSKSGTEGFTDVFDLNPKCSIRTKNYLQVQKQEMSYSTGGLFSFVKLCDYGEIFLSNFTIKMHF